MTPTEIKAWRKSMGWTQPKAAEALDTPLRTYKNWELGENPAPGAALVAMRLIAGAVKKESESGIL